MGTSVVAVFACQSRTFVKDYFVVGKQRGETSVADSALDSAGVEFRTSMAKVDAVESGLYRGIDFRPGIDVDFTGETVPIRELRSPDVPMLERSPPA